MTHRDAFQRAGYTGATVESLDANAAKVIGRDRVQAALAALRNQTEQSKLEAGIKAAVMSGEEALQRLSTFARADIGAVLPEGHPLKQLPPEARMLIRAVRPGRYGDVIELIDPLRATELMAKAGGKLKEQHEVERKVLYEEIVAGLRAPKTDGASA